MFDVDLVRAQFPALQQSVHGSPLVYLDSAATTQKPQCVIDAISHYYSRHNANVHRGSHSLTAEATSQFEQARHSIAQFIGAQSDQEIIWTRGATEALNLIAQTYARSTLQPVMRFWLVRWSITPISFHGKWSPSKRGQKW